MRILINGTSTEMDEGGSIVDVVRQAGHNGAGFGVAVALNGEVVARSAWENTRLSSGDKVEVLVAAQGG